jgi:hypothetical protein
MYGYIRSRRKAKKSDLPAWGLGGGLKSFTVDISVLRKFYKELGITRLGRQFKDLRIGIRDARSLHESEGVSG